MLIQDNKYR